jgi:2-polyprenyl-3-methyl-5-hydroxy-6-metoxy-1,4-benzoquinol methylase
MVNEKMLEYRPREYWDGLLQQRFDLRSVGYPSLSEAFNACLYRAMVNSVDRGLRRVGVFKKTLSESLILDVGSGTGFWIDFWLAKGAQQIFGIDLTCKSISSLSQKYPQLKFEQRDIADPIDSWTLNTFDVISAMSVLHHILSQERWEQALVNLCCVLKPGGYMLIMDPILRYRWWGKPFSKSSPGRPRTVAEHQSVLKGRGISILVVIPTVAILANPVDTRRRVEFRALEQWWNLFCRVASRERPMRNIWRPVYALDRLLCRLSYMPSSKIILCRKGLYT